jgi:hypothetical protein
MNQPSRNEEDEKTQRCAPSSIALTSYTSCSSRNDRRPLFLNKQRLHPMSVPSLSWQKDIRGI